jgi:2-oxoglutarate ferredoxin oxidoreductase subunit delta
MSQKNPLMSENAHNTKNPPMQSESEKRQSGSTRKKLFIYRDWCKQCGICTAFCPTGSLEMGPAGPEWKFPDTCAGCRACELRCPDFAIELIQDVENTDAPEE